jgi:hypothetical protein
LGTKKAYPSPLLSLQGEVGRRLPVLRDLTDLTDPTDLTKKANKEKVTKKKLTKKISNFEFRIS